MGDLDLLCGGSFNAREAKAAGGNFSGDPIAPGWYPVQIESVEVKATKAGTGKYVALVYNIIGDQFNGRKLFDNLNIVNPSARAVEIGLARLGSLCINAGCPDAHDTSELFGRTLEVKVANKKDRDEVVEVIRDFRPMPGMAVDDGTEEETEEVPPPPPAPDPAPAKKPAGTKKRALPWQKAGTPPAAHPAADPDDLPPF